MAVIYKPENVVLVNSDDDTGVSKDDFELVKSGEQKTINFPKDLQLWDTVYIDKSKY